jgi:hypothetical protein
MKVLLITHEPDNWEKLKDVFKKNFIGLELVIGSEHPQIIDLISYEGPFGFFMVDAKIPRDEITDMLNDLMGMAGERPIIIFGGEEDLKGISNGLILKNPHNSVLNDPTNIDELGEVVAKAMQWTKDQNFAEGGVGENPDDYMPMKIKNFYFYSSFPYDVYVKISENQFIRALERNTPILHTTLQKFIKRGVDHLHLERTKHIEFLQTSISKAAEFLKKNKEQNKTLNMAHLRSLSLFHDYIKTVGIDKGILKFTDLFIENMLDSVTKIKNFRKLFKSFPHQFEGIVSKSILSAYVANMIMEKMKWSPDARKKILLACLLQDTYLEHDGLSKVTNLKESELKDFEERDVNDFIEHPKKAAEIAEQFTAYPDVNYLLSSHHELPNREGFPNRPSPSEMQPAQCILNLSINFAMEMDGQEVNDEVINFLVEAYGKSFNTGNFKPPYKALKESIG